MGVPGGQPCQPLIARISFVTANSIHFQIRGTEALACQEAGGRGLLSRYSNNNIA
jgi:hypothetical protein